MTHPNPHICAILLAAGKGTRMKSKLPKVLHEVAGTPILSRILHTLRSSGVQQHCLVLGGDLQNFDGILKENSDITCVIQKNRRGTGDAVASALCAFEGYNVPSYASGEVYAGSVVNASHVLISAGDTPALSAKVLSDFVERSLAEDAKLSVIGMRHPKPFGYGRLVVNDGTLDKIVEEKDADAETRKINLCNTGVIFAETKFLFDLVHQLNNNNAQGEYYLTDCFELAREQGSPAMVFETEEFRSFDGVNNRSQLCQIEDWIIAQKRLELMQEGVTFKLQDTCYVEDQVSIGPDSTIGPHCSLIGHTKIGANCVIGAQCIIENQILPDGTVIEPGSVLRT
ncbi:NTP transferase domain-containing protein [Pseudobacteriovorax antillogorgiicola]|uniref:UDP-N-acetylglucosamine diphosphorylase/glucosamine-1-phosphate N-acetyltransferase n=1 Tax=Pseudobacteriovorax antillogorgiicola TaxID=1513793 RepID=A0A1Y6CNL9_9BACT|nr:NTP transferase domain-containing protein [Pseudobacteriovorax antillogorgiicola]TCS46691.1 UDP-N-acetylglucosamine diphosphorylase/glucosamine-1-phosphate N-acetyltransferase [Pseudobacteriovorax antillogorgiicola]SMF66776.1 UDP-N-acetylglucosamine diphosphorylase/glucosamine-1-phosphate N-acetyltransferase [Pseudobacteriovorax antillogorgiicola]